MHLLAHLLFYFLKGSRVRCPVSIPTCSLNCLPSGYPASPVHFSLFTISCLISSHFCLLPCLTCSLQSSVSSICCSSKPLMFTVLPSSLPPFLLAVFPHQFTVKPLLFATFPQLSIFFKFIIITKISNDLLQFASCFQIVRFGYVSLHCFYFRFASDFSWFALIRIKQKNTHSSIAQKPCILPFICPMVFCCLLHNLSKHLHLETSRKKMLIKNVNKLYLYPGLILLSLSLLSI